LASAESSVLLCDTSGLLAYFDADQEDHAAVSAAIERESGPFVVSPYVLAELDYLLGNRCGTTIELVALRELAGGAWKLPCLNTADVQHAADVVERYHDQEIGLADASLVLLAGRYRTNRLLTLDQRHFRVLRTPNGAPFTLLPG
jgi:predicted nucleic acid-binding protein